MDEDEIKLEVRNMKSQLTILNITNASVVAERLDNVNNRLNIDTRLNTMDTRLNTMDTRLSTIDTRLNTMDTRLNTITADVAMYNTSLTKYSSTSRIQFDDCIE